MKCDEVDRAVDVLRYVVGVLCSSADECDEEEDSEAARRFC